MSVMDLSRHAVPSADHHISVRADGAGDRVLVLPVWCKAQAHMLASVGCQVRVVDGEVCVRCPACGAIDDDCRWHLPAGVPVPRRAEFLN